MSNAPGDYRFRCGLPALLGIRTAACAAPDLLRLEPVFTVCFWIKATAGAGTQVIVNAGHRCGQEPGWACFLHDGRLVVSAGVDAGRRAAIDCAYPQDAAWHHVAAVVDMTKPAVTAALDGVRRGWRPSRITLQPPAPPGGDLRLTVGGYTDAAGGHFDYSFGRNGSGYVDDLRLYGRGLTTDEIARLAARHASGSRHPLHARFTWQAERGDAPVRVRFTADAATGDAATGDAATGDAATGDAATGDAATGDAADKAANDVIYLWTWPDGSQAAGRTAEHEFAYAGSHQVRLDVIGARHAQASAAGVLVLGGAASPLRVTPVFRSGEGGYAAFRIPSIVCAANGDLLAFAEGRVESASDSTATIRIVCKRSRDNGRTWGPLAVAANNVVDGVEHAAMNAAPVVDTVHGTGRIILLFKKLECSEWEIVQGRGVMRTFCRFSHDHGRTWDDERDITAQVHRPYQPAFAAHCPAAGLPANAAHDWRIQVPTLGHAIQLRGAPGCPAVRGRILHIGSRTRGSDSVFESMNYAFWSDDLGHTWQIGESITTRWDGAPARGLNEATAVELADGRVLVNSRNYRDGAPVRLRAVTTGSFEADGRLAFGPAYDAVELVEPAVQASILRFTWPGEHAAGARSRILFANPADAHARANMTVRLSYDEGATWPVAKVIDPGPSAYSDLVRQADGDIGLLYERGNAGGIVYASFPLAWLTDGEDRDG